MMMKLDINFLLFMLLACLWSGSFIGIKIVVESWPPFFGAAIRVGIALLALSGFMIAAGKSTKIAYSLRWKIWLVGLFSQAIPFIFLFWGEQYISPGLAGILNGTVPLWVFLLSLLFFPNMKVFSFLKLIGLMIGMVGVVLVFWPMIFEKNLSLLGGSFAILVMAISYAIGGILNQHIFSRKTPIPFFTNIYHQHWASLSFLVIVSLLFEKWPKITTLFHSSSLWLASLYLGVFSTAIAWILYYRLIRDWGAIRASTVLYIIPVLALIWDYVIYSRVPHLLGLLGVVVILLGIVFIQLPHFYTFYTKKPVPCS